MRHRNGFSNLGRTHSHRKAMLSNMAISLIQHKRISTTVTKAKALRTFVEPLVRKAQIANSSEVQNLDEQARKDKRVHLYRQAFKNLNNKYAVNELFSEVGVKVGEREGGYTRILKTGTRLGDNAEMCIIELVDYNENMLKEPKAKKARRTRRRSKKADDAAQAEAPVAEATEEAAEATEEKKSEE